MLNPLSGCSDLFAPNVRETCECVAQLWSFELESVQTSITCLKDCLGLEVQNPDTCGCVAATGACVADASCSTAIGCISTAVATGSCASFSVCPSCTAGLSSDAATLISNYAECIECSESLSNRTTSSANGTVSPTAGFDNCAACTIGCESSTECANALECYLDAGDGRRGGAGRGGVVGSTLHFLPAPCCALENMPFHLPLRVTACFISRP